MWEIKAVLIRVLMVKCSEVHGFETHLRCKVEQDDLLEAENEGNTTLSLGQKRPNSGPYTLFQGLANSSPWAKVGPCPDFFLQIKFYWNTAALIHSVATSLLQWPFWPGKPKICTKNFANSCFRRLLTSQTLTKNKGINKQMGLSQPRQVTCP